MIKLFLVFKIFFKNLNILTNFQDILQNYHASFFKIYRENIRIKIKKLKIF